MNSISPYSSSHASINSLLWLAIINLEIMYLSGASLIIFIQLVQLSIVSKTKLQIRISLVQIPLLQGTPLGPNPNQLSRASAATEVSKKYSSSLKEASMAAHSHFRHGWMSAGKLNRTGPLEASSQLLSLGYSSFQF